MSERISPLLKPASSGTRACFPWSNTFTSWSGSTWPSTAPHGPYPNPAAAAVILSPIDYSQVETHRLTGRVLQWQWVRAFSPFVNMYAVVFLIGGAILSALRYSANPATRHRVVANVLIAIGAILPGIGGTATRMGYTEVLYVTELMGLLLIWAGYRMSVAPALAVATA